jgi:hypothetical protein
MRTRIRTRTRTRTRTQTIGVEYFEVNWSEYSF